MGLGKRLVVFFFIIVILALLSVYYPYLTGKSIEKIPVNEKENYKIETAFVFKVIDGDTIKTSAGNIRLLGINTPEKNKPYYNEAKNFLLEIENQSIEILRDKEDLDKYKRKLRYIFYNNRFINVEILEKGLATSFIADGLVYENKLKTAENFARGNEIGLWERSRNSCVNCIKLKQLEPVQDYFILKNDCESYCNLNGWFVKDDANHFFYLEDINPKQEKTYQSKQKIWNNKGDRFFLRDEKGKLVLFYEYGEYSS